MTSEIFGARSKPPKSMRSAKTKENDIFYCKSILRFIIIYPLK